MGIIDAFKATSIKSENERLTSDNAKLSQELADVRAILTEIGGNDVEHARAKAKEYEIQCRKLKDEIALLRQMRDDTTSRIAQNQKEILVQEDTLLLESFALYKPKFSLMSSADFKERLEKVRDQQKALIRAGEAVRANESWTVNGSATEGKKMVADMKKLLLRSFNNESDYCVDNVKFSNIESF